MGKTGNKIIKVDKEKLIKKLNKALADEWLAYYQYWIGSKVVKGVKKEAVIAELVEHATDELRHANLLVERIMQLGGDPIIDPTNWYELTNCGYEVPADYASMPIVKQNIKGERCAIEAYQELYEMVKGKDLVTEEIVKEILRDEVEHEDDLEALQEDLEELK
ncbi:MAG: ferritin-like domain-containing protein [Patescibacteria group bacterium]|nr:ferritin-like domain-containing protein [Patescibacteria group bacterium]